MSQDLFHAFSSQSDIVTSFTKTMDRLSAVVDFSNFTIELDRKSSCLQVTRSYLFTISPKATDSAARPEALLQVCFFVNKSASSQAKVVVMAGAAMTSADFPWGSTTDTSQTLEVKLPAAGSFLGQPFTIALLLVGQRDAPTESVMIKLDQVALDVPVAPEERGSKQD